MNPEFPRIGQAIKYTLEYYDFYQIATWFRNPHKQNSQDWTETVLSLHNKMEDEIKQTIHTTNANTQIYLFESLKELLEDNRIKSINSELILNTIHEYNGSVYSNFELLIETKVEEFRRSPNFYREHLEEYEEASKPNALSGGYYYPFRKTKKINYKFYCIKEVAEYIDLVYLDKYLNLVTKIIENFRRILSKYVKLYDEGKVFENNSLRLPFVEPKNHLPLLEESMVKKKLKVNLTVSQITYLFKLLNETNLINNSTNKEICHFISCNFITKASDDISTKNLMNHFSNTDKITASFWINLLAKMKTIANKV